MKPFFLRLALLCNQFSTKFPTESDIKKKLKPFLGSLLLKLLPNMRQVCDFNKQRIMIAIVHKLFVQFETNNLGRHYLYCQLSKFTEYANFEV